MLSRSRTPSLTLLAMLALAACGQDQPGSTGPESPPADLQTFFSSLPAWDAFSPPLPDTDMAVGDAMEADTTTAIDGEPYQCTTTPYSLTTTPEDIVTLNPDVEVLWLGSLLQGDGYLGGIGSLAELPIRQRAPLQVTLDLLSGDNTETVESPTVATVNQAIGRLIQTADQAGHRAGSNIFYTSETTHSLDQASLEMGLSASYMGSTIKTSLSADISNDTRTVTAYFIQRMFTASMVLPQHPEDVFSDEFTQDMLDREEAEGRMGSDNPPVFVSSIAYGRILMFSFTSTSSESKIKETLNALYNGGQFGGQLDSELQSVLDHAEIRVVTVGGDADHALDLIRSNDLGAYFTSDAPLTTARPISYTVRNLDDNVIARVSETTQYDLQQCIPADVPITGARYRFKLTKVVAEDLPFPWVLGGRYANLAYTFYVEDAAHGPRVGAKWEHKLLDQQLIKEGQQLLLVGQPTPDLEEDIHFDGRDAITVSGDLWDYYFAPNPKLYQFSRTFRWPNKTLPTHDSPGASTTTASDFWGNTFRLYWTWQKIEDLTD